MANLGTAYIKIAPDLTGVQSKISNSINRAASSSETTKGISGIGAAVAGAVAGVVSTVTSKAINMVTDSIGAGIKRVDIMNNFPKVMSNMGISAEASSAVIKDLSKKLQGLPTALDTATSSVQRLTTKTNDINKAKDIFLALNNAVIAGGAPMEIQSSAMEQFSQSFAKGKPDMMEWRTLVSAMPAQLGQLAKAMKFKSADELGEALRKGEVSMDDFANQLIKLNQTGGKGFPSFADQAKNAAGGIQTGMTNMRTAITRGVAKIIGSLGSANISEAFSKIGGFFENVLLDKAADAISKVVGWLKEHKDQIVDLSNKIRDYLEPKFIALYNTINEKIMPILKDLWKNVIEPLIPVIGTTLVFAIGAVTDAFNVVLGAIGWVWQAMKDGNPIIWLLVGTFGSLAAVMAFNAIFDALTVGFWTLRLITIPSVMASLETLKIAIATPVVMGAIGIGAAIAALALVMQKAQETQAQIERTKNAAANMEKSTQKAIDATLEAVKNGKMTAEEGDRRVTALRENMKQTVQSSAWGEFVKVWGSGDLSQVFKKIFNKGYASGGFTGRGDANEVAGVVHRGEFVVPKNFVDQQTGLPKTLGGGQIINQTNNVYTEIDMNIINRNLIWELNRA